MSQHPSWGWKRLADREAAVGAGHVFAVEPGEVGTIAIASPDAWCTWNVRQYAGAEPQLVRQLRTGPGSILTLPVGEWGATADVDVLRIASGETYSQTTGLRTSGGTPTPRVRAWWWPDAGVGPVGLDTLTWRFGTLAPRDAAELAGGTVHTLGVAPGWSRRAQVRLSAAPTAIRTVGPGGDITFATSGTSADLVVGPWDLVQIETAPATPCNALISWSRDAA